MKLFILLSLLVWTSSVFPQDLRLLEKAKEQEIELTKDEKLLLRGPPPSKETYVIGGILGTYPGFGLGHAIQGRWQDTGWIYTVGETSALVVAGVGIINCFGDSVKKDDCDRTAINIGFGAYLGFKIAEIFDVWIGGARHRERYDRLRSRIEKKTSWTPFLQKQGGGVAYAWRW